MKWKTLALALLAVSAAAPARAHAQVTGAELVAALMERVGNEMQQRGFQADTEMGAGTLGDDDTETMTFSVEAGTTYFVVGMCDENCSDLDLLVQDSNGETLGSDVLEDDQPVVSFQAARSGTVRAGVLMAACSTGSCNYGVRVYAGHP